MLTQFIRVFKGNEDLTDPTNPIITLTDVSMENAEKSGISPTEKYIYIAKKFPFNNIFLLLDPTKLNTVTSKVKIEYWNDADGWIQAKDVLDFTKGLKKSGMIQFQLDNLDSWDCIPETDIDDDAAQVPLELTGLAINDCHWMRLSYDVAPLNTAAVVDDPLTVGVDETAPQVDVSIKCFTYAFTTTEKVNGVDLQAPKYYDSFATGKTDWLDEIISGSEMMISEMKTSGLLKGDGQIILIDDFVLPCAWRVLEHIYFQMGTAYEGKRGDVKAQYKNFLAGPKSIDTNKDGRLDKKEEVASAPRIYR